MRIVFRADASRALGTGHVMRCSAIAENAIQRGINCTFVGKIDNLPWVESRIKELGFIQISNVHEYEHNSDTDILVLDSYTLKVNDGFIDPKKWKGIVLISDDSTPDYFADLAIHPGLLKQSKKFNAKKFRSGLEFVPLRSTISRRANSVNSTARNIVVFAGGSDPFNLAFEVAKLLTEIPDFDQAIFFSQQKVEIRDLDSRFVVKDFGVDLDVDMDLSDLVVTTASTSSLEVLAREIPLGIVCAVKNQKLNYQELGKIKVASQIGERLENGLWVLKKDALLKLIRNSDYRKNLVTESKGLIDFKGASRIIDCIAREFRLIK